jgi:hypothetical protein
MWCAHFSLPRATAFWPVADIAASTVDVRFLRVERTSLWLLKRSAFDLGCMH